MTEICEEAAVGRKTFYRNFDLREDVIEFQLDRLCQQYTKEIVGMSSEQYLRHHFEFVQRNAEFFIGLYKNGFYQLAYSKFAILRSETMPKWSVNEVEQEYRSAYIISGIKAIQRVWMERGLQESIDEVLEIVGRAQAGQVPLVVDI